MKYTYLIGWKSLDVWYYGVRYANTKPPTDDLWKEYFTSSKYVHDFCKTHGPPDVIKIHKIFDSVDEAIHYESKFLRRVKAKTSERWLNKNDVLAPPQLVAEENGFFGRTHSEEQKLKWSRERTGRPLSDETKLKLKGRTPWNKGVRECFSEQTLQKMSEAKKGKPSWNSGKTGIFSQETLQKMSNAKAGKTTGPFNE